MADTLRLKVVLDMAERVLAPMKRIQSGSSDTAKALKATRDQLRELEGAQKNIEGFGNTRLQMQALQSDMQKLTLRRNDYNDKLLDERVKHQENAAALRTAREAHRRMTQAVERGAQVTPEFARQLELVRDKLQASEKAHYRSTAAMRRAKEGIAATNREMGGLRGNLENAQARMRGYQERLEKAGISTDKLGQASARLQPLIERETAALQKQQQALEQVRARQEKLNALKEQHGKAMLHTGMAAGAGMAMKAAGTRGVEIGMGPVRNYAQHEAAMLGIARQVPGARNEMGQLTEVYRQAEREVRELSGQIPLATTEIAAMMTAAARMEVPTGQLKEFTLLASQMATAFDAVPDQVTESMGKVAKNFKIPLTEIRGLADSINYLDDNAISKGADIIDFLNRTSGVVSTVAMSARDAAALGSTLLTLGERTETAGTAANAIVQKFAAATKGTKKFRSALDEIGLSADAIQMGMSRDATGTLDKVIAAIGKLPEDKRIGVMVELVGMEHSDTLAKLVDKPEELARQRALANGGEAQGSMGREAAARNATLSAQWKMMKNQAFNLGAVVGETLAPALLQLMTAAKPMVEGFARWVKANPALVGGVMKLVIGGSALVAVLGAVLLPLALIAGKAMLIRFLFARLSLGLFGVRAAAAGAGPAMGLLSRVFALVRPAVMGAGRAILWLGRALLATPLGRVLSLLAFSATMVYNNWDGIKGGLVAIWDGITGRISEAISGGVGNWLALLLDFSPIGILHSVIAFALDALGIELPARFSTLGANLISGLVGGITSGLGWLKDTVVGVASSVAGWFAEKLGINSPSRVFMQYGGWVSEGAALGIAGGQGAVRNAALSMATAATLAMPMAADAAALRLDTRPPMAAHMAAQAGGSGGNTYTITINPAAGADPQAIARAVSAELDRRERSQQSRRLSALHDID